MCTDRGAGSSLLCIVSDAVTKEAKITDNILFVELEKEKWVQTILKQTQGYRRVKVDRQIRDAGYDIRREIKVLEELYSEVRQG